MKKFVLTLACLAVLSSVGGVSSRAASTQKSSASISALRVIKENAEAAKSNAAIYQWKRVNLEVDRIAAAAHKAPESAALQEAVRALRSGRLAHDVDRIEEAAQKLVGLCDELLNK